MKLNNINLFICFVFVGCVCRKTMYSDEEALALLAKQVAEISKKNTLNRDLIMRCEGGFLDVHIKQCHLKIQDTIRNEIHTYCSNNYAINKDSIATKVFYVEMLVFKSDRQAKIIYDIIKCKPACIDLPQYKIDIKKIDGNLIYLYYLSNIDKNSIDVYTFNH